MKEISDKLPYDPRTIANWFIRKGQQQSIHLTNISIQKLTFFSHVEHLVTYKKPLTRGRIEAWDYGPVYPSIYENLKMYSDGRISDIILIFDHAQENYLYPVLEKGDETAETILNYVWSKLNGYSAFELSEISHYENSPWYNAYHGTRARSGLNRRIHDDEIVKFYSDHRSLN